MKPVLSILSLVFGFQLGSFNPYTNLFVYRRNFYDKRMAQEVGAECLGDEWKVIIKHSLDNFSEHLKAGYELVKKKCGAVFFLRNSRFK